MITTRDEMRNLRNGDHFVDPAGLSHVADGDAHYSGDASFDGYVVYATDGDMFFEDEFPTSDDDLDLAYEEAALRDWELSAIEVGDYLIDNDTIVRVVSIDHSTGEYSFSVKYPAGYVTSFDASRASRCKVVSDTSSWEDQRRAAELWAGHAITSHATYYVVEFDGDYLTATVNFSQADYESREQWQRRRAQAFFRTVAERYAFNDCGDDRILEVVFDGLHVEYAGWQPGMLIEFREATTGLIVFSERFPEWDH